MACAMPRPRDGANGCRGLKAPRALGYGRLGALAPMEASAVGPKASLPLPRHHHSGAGTHMISRRGFAIGLTGLCLVTPDASAKPKRKRRAKGFAGGIPANRKEVEAGESCSCRSKRVCVGPRGGRYCITSGGRKRYP